MNSALHKSLSEDQYKRLVKAALCRYKAISEEKERSQLEEDLKRFELRAEGDYSDRTTPGNANRPLQKIFSLKNETLGIIRSVKRFLLARICKDLFGSEPIFYVRPEGKVDKPLAEAMQKHAGWKLRQADYKAKIKRAIDTLFDVGFVAIKTTWDVQEDVSESLEMILVHKADGAPVLTQDGDYIYEDDETFDPNEQGQPVDAASAEGSEQGQPAGVEGMQEEAAETPEQEAAEQPEAATPLLAFVKAPEVVLDASLYTWAEHLVEQKVRLYSGLRIDACERKDVFWPINVPNMEESDMIAHRYDRPLSELRAKYAPESFDEDAEEQGPAAEEPEKVDSEVSAILGKLKNESQSPKSEASKPMKNEAEASGQDEDPMIQVAECSFDFDCFEDGKPRRLHLVLLPQQNECIYAEYRAAMAPRAAKNIHLLAINRRRNRAYGRGLWEVYENLADAADQLLNAILYRNSYVADPTKIWNPQNTAEGKANPDLKFEPGATYSTVSSQTDPKNILNVIEIPDLDERTWKLMELFMQLIQLDSGVTNANQGDVSNLPSNSTATGINSMLESSSVLHQYVLEEIRDCLTPQLAFAIGLIYLKQDGDETYEYLQNDADPAAEQVMLLKDAKKLRHLPMNVDILLTRTKRQEWREAATAAIPMGVQYGQLPPADQTRMREAFLQLFRALDFPNPEDFFPLPDPNRPPPGPPPPRATESIALKGADLAPSQKDWLVQQFGGPPAKPEEIAAQQGGQSGGATQSPTPSGPAQPLPSNVIDDSGNVPERQSASDGSMEGAA
ncbi:MAG: hypothetical protein ABJF10_24515 [Chthoniobacter sp.]|uniref:portal protein n=1 Tax=Chthoniobacter sp. TaxID=2510640 RepID=UPI0032A1ECF1